MTSIGSTSLPFSESGLENGALPLRFPVREWDKGTSCSELRVEDRVGRELVHAWKDVIDEVGVFQRRNFGVFDS